MSYIFYNGKILTLDSNNKIAESILIIDNRIIAVGKFSNLQKQAPSNTQFIDLTGRVVLPGFVDTHTHFYGHSKLQQSIYLEDAESVSEIEEILGNYFVKNSSTWIEGIGWDINRYPDSEKFNVKLLDKYFPNNPVSLASHDVHTHICNSVALKIMGITEETPDPSDGRYGHFADGELDGFLYEKTWEVINKHRPKVSTEIKMQLIKDSIKESWKLGLVGVHDMEDYEIWETFNSISFVEYPFRFYYHFRFNDLDKMIAKEATCYQGNEERKLCGIKIFADGALGSHTAFMFDNYPNEPENYGVSIQPKEELRNLVFKAAQHKIPSSIHAIGDRANSEVIDIFDQSNKINGWLPHRIEHFQCVKNAEFPKVVENRIHCAVQPIHLKEDIENIERILPNSANDTYSFKDEIDAGICLSFGSDAPIETINPFLGIYAAITRKSKNNPQNNSWRPDQKLSIWEALKGYTINAAKASLSEKFRGSLEAGKLADLIVLDDFFDKEDEFWLSAESQLTMVDGRIVYNAMDD